MRTFLSAIAITFFVGLSGAPGVSAQVLDGLPGAGKAAAATILDQAQYNDNSNGYSNDNGNGYAPQHHCHRQCARRDYYNHCVEWERVCD